MLILIFGGGGLLLGFLVGRWWTVVAAVGVGLWAGITEELELEGWAVALIFSSLTLIGIGAGILLRRLTHRVSRPRRRHVRQRDL
jgi:hypothetical protein